MGEESIRALATVTLDARSLESLGPQTLDRLAELVEARMLQRRAAGEDPLLSATAAAELVDVSPATVRRAIRSGALEVAGYVGSRPRVRRGDVVAWVATGPRPPLLVSEARAARPGFRPRPRRRVMGDAIEALGERAA